jgi:hypothetical protein
MIFINKAIIFMYLYHKNTIMKIIQKINLNIIKSCLNIINSLLYNNLDILRY